MAKGSNEGKAMGQNIMASMEGDILVLRVDMSARLGRSKSGKSTLIATTNGSLPVPDAGPGVKANINLYLVE